VKLAAVPVQIPAWTLPPMVAVPTCWAPVVALT
jgi:hypothetical protein